ncbi:MAG: hypothetical protein ABFD92_15800 [Planctomycetaceae bacterium]|nr:hypothetical protein [Planctomycetaceae bacterium]
MQTQPPPSPYVIPQQRSGLSGFVKGFTIADLVLCSVRAILVIFSVIGWASLSRSNELYQTAVFEVLSGLGIALLGVPGNILILMKKKIGCALGWGNIVFTGMSIAVALWQAPMLHKMQSGAEAAGFIGGAILAVLVRVGLLVIYIVTVVRASKEIDALSQPQGIMEMPPASPYAPRA